MKESAFAGVTSMRAFVEVDKTVNEQCLNVGRRLKKDYEELCEIQLTGESLHMSTIIETDQRFVSLCAGSPI